MRAAEVARAVIGMIGPWWQLKLLCWLVTVSALISVEVTAIPAKAQSTLTPSEAATAMVGAWELSNAERDKTCTVTFKLDAIAAGRALDLEKICATNLPVFKDVAAWAIAKDDALRLIDAKGKSIMEFTEVESGLFESVHSGESLYFLQTVAALEGREHTPDQMFGDWSIVRGGTSNPICQLTLLNTAADTESFALAVKSGCDSLITRFDPKAWRMDHGQLVVLSARGESWRFEEGDPTTWRRIPQGRQPLMLVRQ